MEFCLSCGILLPLELVGNSRKCRACKNDISRREDCPCECEYCGSISSRKKQSRVRSSKEHNLTKANPQNSHSKRNGRKEPTPISTQESMEIEEDQPLPLINDWGTIMVEEDALKQGWDDQSASRWDTMDYQSQQDYEALSNKQNLHSSSSSKVQDQVKSIVARYDQSQVGLDWDDGLSSHYDWGDYSMTDADDFYVDTKDTIWTEVKRKPSSAKDLSIFGDHDFPGLERGLKESTVESNVRDEWERLQEEYKSKLLIKDTQEIARLVSGKRRKSKNRRYFVGGVDISFIKDNATDACACLSVVRLPDLELVYQGMEMIKLTQPYIPGFLAFREVPPLMCLFAKLENEAPQYKPDVIMVDGNGILHPRGFGLASQLGVMLDMPTVGVAKTLMSAQGLVDDNAHKLKKQTLLQAGEGFDLISHENGRVLGKCVRVHDKAPNPVYVSVGHKISLNSAVWLVLECSKYRIPEPIRRADLDSREYIRQRKKEPSIYIK